MEKREEQAFFPLWENGFGEKRQSAASLEKYSSKGLQKLPSAPIGNLFHMIPLRRACGWEQQKRKKTNADDRCPRRCSPKDFFGFSDPNSRFGSENLWGGSMEKMSLCLCSHCLEKFSRIDILRIHGQHSLKIFLGFFIASE